jgi:hypothetical protein
MEVITSWETLMILSKKLGEAKTSGDKKRIKKAQEAHDNYASICLNSDKIILGCTDGCL